MAEKKTPEENLVVLAYRPSLGDTGKQVRLKKVMEVDESAHPGFEVQEALSFKRRKTFRTSALIATQEDVDVEKVRGLLAATRVDPIKVIERRGKAYIIDGHHRFLAAYLRGATTIQALAIKFES